MFQCLIALLWLFGKRIRETLRLKRKDVRWNEKFPFVSFQVMKKKKRETSPIPIRRTKRITIKNPYVHYVIDYVASIENPEAWIFPGRRRKRVGMFA